MEGKARPSYRVRDPGAGWGYVTEGQKGRIVVVYLSYLKGLCSTSIRNPISESGPSCRESDLLISSTAFRLRLDKIRGPVLE